MLGEPTAQRQNLRKVQRGLPEEVLPRLPCRDEEKLTRCTATNEDKKKLSSHEFRWQEAGQNFQEVKEVHPFCRAEPRMAQREMRAEMQQEPLLARACKHVKEFGLYLQGKWEQGFLASRSRYSDLQFRRPSS